MVYPRQMGLQVYRLEYHIPINLAIWTIYFWSYYDHINSLYQSKSCRHYYKSYLLGIIVDWRIRIK